MASRAPSLISLLLAPGVAAALAARAPAQASLAERVNAAIDRGVAKLESQENADGSFQARDANNFPGGAAALCLYALLKSGVAAKDPAVQRAYSFVAYKPYVKTYSTGVTILALDALHDPTQDERIRAAGKWLEEHQHASQKTWAYPEGEVDLSNTQYAVFGLWTAERHGFQAKAETWGEALRAVLRYQNRDGGFSYKQNGISTGSMTTAGITVAELARARVKKDARYATAVERSGAALARAYEWLDRNFDPSGNPQGGRALSHDWHYYWLYGLERVGAISSKSEFGGKNWYRDGAQFLVDTQKPEGDWGDLEETAFALLFLRRATFTTLHEKEGASDEGAPKAAAATPVASAAPIKPRADTPFLQRWLVIGPFENPKDDQFDVDLVGEATVVAHPGASVHGATWMPYRSLTPFVDVKKATSPKEHVVYYAFTWLQVAQECDVVFWLSTDDGGKLFLDGQQVFQRHFHEGATVDGQSVKAHLAAGPHRLLLKIEEWTSVSGFFFRVAQRDGTPATGVRPSFSDSDPELAATALAQPGLFTPAELLADLPLSERASLDFRTEKDLEAIAFASVIHEYPRWIETSDPKATRDRPNPGAHGILVVHPAAIDAPARLYRKVRVPASATALLAVRVSAEAYAEPGTPDWRLKLGLFDGEMHWLADTIVGPDAAPSPKNWREVTAELKPWAGREALLVVECGAGGKREWAWEQAFIDEIALR